MICRGIPIVVLLFAAIGAEPVGANYVPPQAPPAIDAGPMILRLFSMTLFVLLLCAGILWCIRYFGRPRLLSGMSNGKLQLLESAWLGRRCSIHLVRAGTARVLIAVDPTGMKSCQIVDDDFAGLIPAADPQDTPPASVAEVMSILAATRAAA
jgi:flagellar biogenesis protein FliO